MSTDSRTMSAFGKRSSDEVWARAQRDRRELTVCPWRFSAWLAGLVGAAFLLLLDAVKLLGGDTEALGRVGEAAVWLAGAPGIVTGLAVLLPAAMLAQLACALVGIGLSAQPLLIVDTAGLTVPARGAGVVMDWEEVARMDFAPGTVRLERRPRAVPRLCTNSAYEKGRARVPLLLVSGGSGSLKEAISAVRPDMARRHIA